MDSAAPRDEESLLLACHSHAADKALPLRNHRRDVHIISCGFLLVFLAYGAAQNLESTLNTTHNLGAISLGILYVSLTIFSLVASLVVRSLGSRNALLLGTTGYWLFILANMKPTWFTMIPASLYLGFAASILWVGQGTYLASAAWSHAIDSKVPKGIVLGSFNGEFWGIVSCQQLLGNLISLAVLQDKGGGNTGGTIPLFVVFLCSMILGTILMCFLRQRDDKRGIPRLNMPDSFYSTMKCQIKFMISPLFDRRIQLLIPMMAYLGLEAAFMWAEFTKDVVKPAFGIRGVGGSMAIYGAFGAIGSLAAGRMTSDLRSITGAISGGVLLQGCVFLVLLVKHRFTGILTSAIPFILAASMGTGDGVLVTQINALLAMLFKENMEATYALSKVWHNGAVAAVFFAGPYIPFRAMLVTMLAAVTVSISSFFVLTFHVEKAFIRSALDL